MDDLVAHVDVHGLRLAYAARGVGPPLVLLHGLPGSHRVWAPQLEGLADDFTVLAWDAPGCGRSSDPAGPFGLTDVARHLVGFIDALQLDRPHLVGLSWGAGLALELYRIAPTVPASLVLASGYAGWAGSLPADAVAARLTAYLTAARDGSGVLREWGAGLFSPTAPADLVDEAVSLVSDFHPGPLALLARSFAETDLRDVLPTIDVPTLVLHGDADTRSPLTVGEALHRAIPRSELVVLAGVGHVSNLEAPDRFNREVRHFLQSV